MDISELFTYTIWADERYLSYCEEITEDQFLRPFLTSQKTIKSILFHIYEVYWYWTQFMTTRDYSQEPNIDGMNRTQIISGIRQFHKIIASYINSENLQGEHTEQWGEDKPVSHTAEQLIFNFVTHNAYHRGQMALLLRECGYDEIKETDFNPYNYMNAQQ